LKQKCCRLTHFSFVPYGLSIINLTIFDFLNVV
jgi:uncharacterized membrane protein YccF (DUF307 family)